ncbi:hypothetical protein H6P81_008118 [Aristolochia fimbriata]|uniref:Uncharacterized protein n=1 Tax=Aristolochia fimbriata TaxID=158543 RepID=A0AAV7F3H8_ARIFI|nr:hypothetical protein H6P81_008118 [Aristolochia fimbriata]
MCPLRLILVFLSATFAGFLLLKGVKSTQDEFRIRRENASINQEESLSLPAKVWSGLCSAFWIFVDMASGRYLWTHLKLAKARSD